MIGRVTETLSKVKDSLGSNERHALRRDRRRSFAVWEAATLLVHLHHCDGSNGGDDSPPTRLLTAQREQMVLERDALDIEWRNLILKKTPSAITAGSSGSQQKSCNCSMLILPGKIS